MESSVSIIACFEALCGVRSVTQLLNVLPSLGKTDDAKFIDDNCYSNCSSAKHWAQWWARCDHLKMLSKSFSMMMEKEKCPSSTNAVELRNKDCKSDTPQCLKLAMIKVYKVDKVTRLKHIAAEKGVVLSYRCIYFPWSINI